MAGLLGEGFEDPRSAAIMALAGGLLRRDFGGGLLGANQAYAQSKAGAMQQRLQQAQLDETLAQAEQRKAATKKELDALQRAAQIRAAIPGLFSGGGMTGGQPVPQEIGGVPMFSKPMGVSPMQATPGGFDFQRALQMGIPVDEITKLAGLQNLGRPKATRQIEVDDGKGGKRIALVDDFGNEVAGYAGYTAPVQVNRGGSVDFVRPAPGLSLSVGMSPGERDASARGWATVKQGQQRLDMDKNQYTFNAELGGYVPKVPGGQFIPLAQNKDATPKLTESQAKSGLYLGQMRSASDTLKQLEQQGVTARPEAVVLAGNKFSNYLAPKGAQQVAQVQNQWSEAYLRAKTGAAATQGEVDLNNRTFFPQPGDSQDVIRQKAQARAQAETDMQLPAGPAATRTKIAAPVNTGGASGGWSIQKVE